MSETIKVELYGGPADGRVLDVIRGTIEIWMKVGDGAPIRALYQWRGGVINALPKSFFRFDFVRLTNPKS